MELITIARYSTAAQELLYEFVIDRPQCWSEPIETLSQHRTIRALLAHSLGAEMRWNARIKGEPQPPRYESTAPSDISQIHKDWRRQRELTTSIIQSADRAELDRVLDVTIPMWLYNGKLSVEEILFHIFSHENYHRGQCSMLLQHQAIDPPNFDYIFVKG